MLYKALSFSAHKSCFWIKTKEYIPPNDPISLKELLQCWRKKNARQRFKQGILPQSFAESRRQDLSGLPPQSVSRFEPANRPHHHRSPMRDVLWRNNILIETKIDMWPFDDAPCCVNYDKCRSLLPLMPASHHHAAAAFLFVIENEKRHEPPRINKLPQHDTRNPHKEHLQQRRGATASNKK